MIEAIADAHFYAYAEDAPTGLVGTIGVVVKDPAGTVAVAHTTAGIIEMGAGTGLYQATVVAPHAPGAYVVIWDVPGPSYSSELLQVTPGSAYVPPGDVTPVADLTDLMVLVPWARRATEGPFGAPAGLPSLMDSQLYAMVADACAEVILFTGTLFGHQLKVADRDPTGGFPTQWHTEVVLDQWEAALIITQTALDYYFHVFRDMKTSEVISNEGTNYEYTLSANVIRQYMDTLKGQRDMALAGLQKHHPVMARYASNIRVRDQATVAVLEWWDRNSPGVGGGSGMPGGQEAYTVPWIPGWFPGSGGG